MLKGKVALVTGASRGIGAAIALELAARGADIAAVCRSGREAAEGVCAQCRERYGVRAEVFLCDVADGEAVKETVARVRAAFGTVHILVNNAGITRDGLIARMKEADFTDVLNTNLLGAFHMIRHCSGLFLRNREGCIINIASAAGLMGNAGQSNYAASKAGLIGLTKSVARELAPRGIRCNAVAPAPPGRDPPGVHGRAGGRGPGCRLSGRSGLCDRRGPPCGRRPGHVRKRAGRKE